MTANFRTEGQIERLLEHSTRVLTGPDDLPRRVIQTVNVWEHFDFLRAVGYSEEYIVEYTLELQAFYGHGFEFSFIDAVGQCFETYYSVFGSVNVPSAGPYLSTRGR